MKPAADHFARSEALDVTHSFIVKAPAGSGKTTLLVKRYLKLLATVNSPEEVVAITFTRKAASEMIGRVLTALESVERADQTDDAELIECAKLALQQDHKRQWQLRNNPSRIRIQTIDALSQQLVRQMPWSAGFGAAPTIIDDDVSQHYSLAARQALLFALSGNEFKSDAENLLLALDNNFSRVCDLLISMLARRDQWQQFLVSELSAEDARHRLEKNWSCLIEQALLNCDQKLDPDLKQELLICARYAAENLATHKPDSPIVGLKDIQVFPNPITDELDTWKALVVLLLTGSNNKYQLRSSSPRAVTKAIGFPTTKDGGDESIKTKFRKVLDVLEDLALEDQLSMIARLPNSNFDENEWKLLTSLTQILKLAVAQLTVIFQQQGVCDHIEIATRANLALGDTEIPTDLALRLDYKIQHLLVDEFQDTSHTQIELLKRLTAGWQLDDGRTLFLVGDPMQSIYRFREADVSIFIQIFEHGFNSLVLNRIELTENFRSEKPLVDWVNHKFTSIFPVNDNQQTTAVKYSFSSAHKVEKTSDQQISIHTVDKTNESSTVCQIIKSTLERADNKHNIAVLVRSRTHLDTIVTGLNEQGIDYQGVKLQKLSGLSFIQDLFALTKALCHPGDHLSWLAILRAPWCGLDLSNLTLIASSAENKTIWQVLEQINIEFDTATQKRIDRFKSILRPAINKIGKYTLHDVVRQAWLELGGADTIHVRDHPNVNTYFQLVNKIESAGQLKQLDQFEKALDELWASTDDSQARLQLMTIHTAKGLEFDTVMLPGLYKKPRPDEAKLLIWDEYIINNQPSLLLSPIKLNHQDSSRYEFIRSLEKNVQREESKRLLYVACTRAIKQLHLFVCAQPDSASLQALMQNQIQDEIEATDLPVNDDKIDTDQSIFYQRLPTDYIAPELPKKRVNQSNVNRMEQTVEYQWAGITAMHMGTLIHEIICKFAEHGETAVTGKTSYWRSRLQALGVESDQLDACIQSIKQSVNNIKTDERAKWILSQTHTNKNNEWQLTSYGQAQLENSIIDRTFIDNEGVRWIIDYKTSTHEGGNIEAFLDSEQQRYTDQLENYAAILRLKEDNPIKLGLYFPLLTAWREWSFSG